jgi:hypothetical protein
MTVLILFLLAAALVLVGGGWWLGIWLAERVASHAEQRYCRDLNDDLKGAAHG